MANEQMSGRRLRGKKRRNQMSGRRLRGEKGRNQMSGRRPRTRGLRGEKGRGQILIVEDDGIIAARLQNILEKLGYNVLGAVASGEEAIQKAGESPLDLVLMYIYLAGNMNGIEAAAAIRTEADIPVIYLTAYSDDTLLRQAKITAPYGYLVKPIQDRELHATIEMALYRHKLETKLKENERWLDTTLRSIGDAVITTDERGYVTFMNRIAEELTGWQQEEALGHDLTEVFHIASDVTGELVEDPVARVIREGVVIGLGNHTSLLKKDGTVIPIDDSAAPIRDDKGNISGVVLVFRDISERKRLEEELLKVQKLESVGILAGGIAHDLNNFLTAVMGNISLAKLYQEPVEKDRRLTEAEKACMQIKDLTKQLLMFSTGGVPVLEMAAIGDLLKNLVVFTLRGSNIRFEFSIPDDLWPVEVDEGQINQVINNLVINARQAMPNGGTIRTSAENMIVDTKSGLPLEAGTYIKVSVEDEGIGIPADHLQKIFDPFFTTKQAGSGLGLATSYSIIENHGGYITVESQIGVGTTFHIYLPASPEGVLIEKEKEKEEPIMGEGRILVMDDEKHVRDLAFDMLHSIGYRATTAVDGDEAIELYKEAMGTETPFDAVIVDLTIPGSMGGRAAIQKLMEIDPEVKAIVSSGYSNDPIMANFREYGFKGVIAKPYRTRELSEILHRVITGTQMRDA